MRTIEVNMMVGKNGEAILQFPPDITPGEYRVVIVTEEETIAQGKRPPLKFSAYPVGWVSEDITFSRRELYDMKKTVRKEKRPPLNFPVDSYGSWPENLSLRREDIYNEWGR